MRHRFLITASATCIASIAMLLCPTPVSAQREGKGGGGGRSGGGNVSRGGGDRSGGVNVSRGQPGRSAAPSAPTGGNVSRGQPGRGEAAPAPSGTTKSGSADVSRGKSGRNDAAPAPIVTPTPERKDAFREQGRSDATSNRATSDINRGRPGATARDTVNAPAGTVNRPDRDPNRRNDWADWNRNQGDWNRNGNNWNRNGNNNWNNNWSNWNRNNPGRNWVNTTPGFWNQYYRNGNYGNPFFGNNYYGNGYLPGYGGYGGYGYGGYGLGGFGLPGIGIGFGLGRLFGGGGYMGSRYGYNQGYYGGNYNTGYGGTYSQTPNAVVTEPADTAVTGDYLESARTAFMNGDYAGAQRLAQHAVIDTPDQAKAHELLSLALFAQGNYAGAAEAAHAAVSLGSVPDWPTLYGYYNDREKYEQHFNAIKQFAHDHPDAPEGRFLLGLHHLMMGHRDPAKNEFAEYLKLVDHQDPIGVKLYGEAGGDVRALPKPTAPSPLPPAAAEVDGAR